MTVGVFYIDRGFASRAEVAQSGIFLVGPYTGWTSFGDYLKLKATVECHERIGAHDALYVLAYSNDRAAYERSVIASGSTGRWVVPIYYHADSTALAANGLGHLVPLPHVPSRSLVHVLGSRFVNESWGHPVRQAVSALMDRHARDNLDGEVRLFISGVQVSAGAGADAWRHLFARAAYVGAGDAKTLALLKHQLNGDAAKVEYSGDDSLLALAASLTDGAGAEPASTIAAHINCAHHSAYDAERRLNCVAAAIGAGARCFPTGATCDLLVTDSADHGTEREAVQQLEARYRRLADTGAVPALIFRIRNIFEEAVHGSLRFGASFLVTSSYHVALMGLLARCPTLLMADNNDHREMGSGLADAFKAERFAAVGNDDDAARTATALLEESCSRPPTTGSYPMWIGQAEKAFRLSRICLDMERTSERNRLDLTASAFREVAANLGELRKRRILEEKLSKELVDQTAITVTIPAVAGLRRYLAASYWERRRSAWVRSIKKRVNKWG